MRRGDDYERLIADPNLFEGALGHAIHEDSLTYGEAVAMLFLVRGEKPINKNPGVFAEMEPIVIRDWTEQLEDELSEQYDIPANTMGKNVKYVEVELPATRHRLNVESSNLYGFVLSLVIFDETGGVMNDVTLGTCVKESQLADTISNVYNSY